MTKTHKSYTIGFDIGGTYFRAVLWDGRHIVHSTVQKTPRSKTSFKRAINRAILKLAPKSTELHGIGISIAGRLQGTVLLGSRNIWKLKNVDLRALVPKNLKLKADNDARAFLRGTPGLTTRYKSKRLLGITLGTGIGRALAVNGTVKTIKRLERAEPWEAEYQRLRFKPSNDLARYLCTHLSPIIKRYRANLVVVGGGVLERKPGLKKAFKSTYQNLGLKARLAYTSHDPLQAARGTALLIA